jgi:exodeoxyribonuclease III
VTYARTGLTKSFTDNPFATDSQESDVGGLSQGRCMLTDHGSFMILNIYAPNAGRGDEYLERKMTFYRELSRAMARWTQAGHKVVITGDINTAHTELDIYNPRKYMKETGFLENEREWITTFLSERKCQDVWREVNPGVRKYTFWDQKRCMVFTRVKTNVVMREKNCGWRIDVFYANEGMMEDVLSSDILNNVSTHPQQMRAYQRSWARIIVPFR